MSVQRHSDYLIWRQGCLCFLGLPWSGFFSKQVKERCEVKVFLLRARLTVVRINLQKTRQSRCVSYNQGHLTTEAKTITHAWFNRSQWCPMKRGEEMKTGKKNFRRNQNDSWDDLKQQLLSHDSTLSSFPFQINPAQLLSKRYWDTSRNFF